MKKDITTNIYNIFRRIFIIFKLINQQIIIHSKNIQDLV